MTFVWKCQQTKVKVLLPDFLSVSPTKVVPVSDYKIKTSFSCFYISLLHYNFQVVVLN